MWIFIDLDSPLDRDVLKGAGDGTTLFECEITFRLNNVVPHQTTDWWLNALKSDDLEAPTMEFDESAGTVAIHFVETVTRPACWFFAAERVVSEALSSHGKINFSQDAFIKHGRVRQIPRSRLLIWRT